MQKSAVLLALRTVRDFVVERRTKITLRVRTVLFCEPAKLLRILNNDDGNNTNNRIICLLTSLLNSLLAMYKDSNSTSRYKTKSGKEQR